MVGGWTDREVDRQGERKTDIYTDRCTDRQVGRRAKTEIPMENMPTKNHGGVISDMGAGSGLLCLGWKDDKLDNLWKQLYAKTPEGIV